MEIVALITSFVVLITAVLALIAAYRRANRIESTMNEVHVLVNSRLQTVLKRVNQLTILLEQQGIPLPDRDNEEEE